MFSHHLLSQQMSTYFVLYFVLNPETVALMDVRGSAFVDWGRHMHKFITTYCRDGTMITRINGSKYAFLSKVARVLLL